MSNTNLSENDLNSILDRLRHGRCVLCAGSRLNGDGTYRSLVEKLLAQVPDVDRVDAEKVLKQRPLAAAGFVRRRLGDRFNTSLKAAAAIGAELPEAIKLLGELPFRAVVTT